MWTKTQELALAWAEGGADIGEVVALVWANPRIQQTPTKSLDEMFQRELDDDSPPLNMDGWDGIQYLRMCGRLSDEQFDTLYEAAKM